MKMSAGYWCNDVDRYNRINQRKTRPSFTPPETYEYLKSPFLLHSKHIVPLHHGTSSQWSNLKKSLYLLVMCASVLKTSKLILLAKISHIYSKKHTKRQMLSVYRMDFIY